MGDRSLIGESRLRILFFTPAALDKSLGAAKVVLELGEALARRGWKPEYAGPNEVAPGKWYPASPEGRQQLVTNYLRRRTGEFDVLDYDHAYGPGDRAAFPANVLMVARSVLLAHNVARIPIPHRPGLRRWFGQLLLGRRRRLTWARITAIATRACAAADLVNVCNTDEADELRRHGIPPEKVMVLPFGLTAERRAAMETVSLSVPERPCIAFVGSFDPRKGMRDYPRIVSDTVAAIPTARFKLLGTAGMLQTADEVYAEFPARLRPAIDVVPRFDPAELPKLLADCSAGVFPSAVEGFPFGVLEMLAVGLPVVAYRSPGPPMMLPDEYLIPRGDAAGVASRLAALLSNPEKLQAARVWARERSRAFDWDDVAAHTASLYETRLVSRWGADRAEITDRPGPPGYPQKGTPTEGEECQNRG
jgi:glycosyltransferase involved in cell wall biosynthesis